MHLVPAVVGCGRSGTTLLRAMLDSHPCVAVPGESNFVALMAHRRSRYETARGLDIDTFANDLFDDPGFEEWPQRWQLNRDEVGSVLAATPPAGLADGIRLLYHAYAQKRGKTRYGDKTPSNVRHLLLLSELFPEWRFVHVIRDGRDVALSFVDTPFGVRTVAHAAAHWRREVRRGLDAGAVLGPGRYLEVRYEDLVDRPQSVLRRISALVDLDFHPAMLEYPDRAQDVLGTVMHPAAHGHLYRPPTTGLRDWRTQMRSSDVAVFEAIAGDLLVELGYERMTEGRSAAAQVERVRAWFQWQVARGRSLARRAGKRTRSGRPPHRR